MKKILFVNNKNKNWQLIFTLIWFMAGFITICYSDDGVFHGAGFTVYPINEDKIKMESMQVQITKNKDRFEVDANFIFKNTGDAKEIQMGFPDNKTESKGDTGSRYAIHDFKVFVNNQKFEPILKEGAVNDTMQEMEYDRVYTWLIKFGPGETKNIKNTYYFYPNDVSPDQSSLDYVLKTGSLWKDSIDKANLTISNLDVDLVTYIVPEGYSIENGKIIWSWENFEPEEDIIVLWHEQGMVISEAETFLNTY